MAMMPCAKQYILAASLFCYTVAMLEVDLPEI